MGLLERLFGSADRDGDDPVERLVDSINPRLRLGARYRERLRPAAEAAVTFARRLVAALPPACEASAAAWSAQPCMRAFFATAGEVPVVLGRSAELRDYLAAHPALPQAYALLRMDYGERRVLGMSLAADVVQRDVAQTTVNFGGHRLRVFGESEQALREALERRAFDQLSLLALARLGEAQSDRLRLESERSLLAARLRLLQHGGIGLAPVVEENGGLPLALEQVELDLECNARQLAAGSGAARLDFELGCVCDALLRLPEQVRVERCRIRVDSMNVLTAGDAGRDVEFALVRVGEGGGRAHAHAFAAVCVPRDEPCAPPTLAEATRNIVL